MKLLGCNARVDVGVAAHDDGKCRPRADMRGRGAADRDESGAVSRDPAVRMSSGCLHWDSTLKLSEDLVCDLHGSFEQPVNFSTSRGFQEIEDNPTQISDCHRPRVPGWTEMEE